MCSGGSRRPRLGKLGRFWRLVGSDGWPPVTGGQKYLENGLKLPKMQKIYIKMFGSNATFFFRILSLTAHNTKKFRSESNRFLKFGISQLTVAV